MNDSFKLGFEKTAGRVDKGLKTVGNYVGKIGQYWDDMAKKRAASSAVRKADKANYFAQFDSPAQKKAVEAVSENRPLIKDTLKNEMPGLSKHTKHQLKGTNSDRLYRKHNIGSNVPPRQKDY